MARPAYFRVWKTWERLTVRPNGNNPIVVQGIQRSGTNFLSQLLIIGGYGVLNQVDPPRDDPRHKHFRWFADKDAIVMDSRYRNRAFANSIREVNSQARWPDGTRHVVLFRDPEDWLNAIFRWGLENDWFESEAAFLQSGRPRAFMAEWHAYYAQWQQFVDADPDLGLILRFSDLKSDPSDVLARIDRFADVQRDTQIDPGRSIRKVRHSKPINAPRQRLEEEESLAAASMNGAFDWHRYCECRP